MPTEKQNGILRHEQFNRNKVRFLSGLSFVIGFLDAFLLYTLSSYFVLLSGEESVGGFYLVAFIFVLFLLMQLQPLVHRFGAVRLLLFFFVLLIGSSFYLSLSSPTWLGAAVLLLFLVANNVMWSVMDVLLEDFSSDQVSGRVRGFYLTILNAGLLLAPFLSTRMLSQFGYEGIFAVLTLGYIFVFLAALLGLRGHQTISPAKIFFRATITKVLQRKNLLSIYCVSWVLEFFYVVMIIYSPILLLARGFSWADIGFMFTVMLIPFVVVQYPLGILADKKWGEKELLFGSLVIMSVATAVVGWLHSDDIYLWAGVLFLTRLGAAGIEILRDSYFYKQIDRTDTDIVAFFRTARPTANIFGALISIFFLSIFPMHGLFFLVAAFALAACFAVLILEDSRSEAEVGVQPV